jgi:hypothetical protein
MRLGGSRSRSGQGGEEKNSQDDGGSDDDDDDDVFLNLIDKVITIQSNSLEPSIELEKHNSAVVFYYVLV